MSDSAIFVKNSDLDADSGGTDIESSGANSPVTVVDSTVGHFGVDIYTSGGDSAIVVNNSDIDGAFGLAIKTTSNPNAPITVVNSELTSGQDDVEITTEGANSSITVQNSDLDAFEDNLIGTDTPDSDIVAQLNTFVAGSDTDITAAGRTTARLNDFTAAPGPFISGAVSCVSILNTPNPACI